MNYVLIFYQKNITTNKFLLKIPWSFLNLVMNGGKIKIELNYRRFDIILHAAMACMLGARGTVYRVNVDEDGPCLWRLLVHGPLYADLPFWFLDVNFFLAWMVGRYSYTNDAVSAATYHGGVIERVVMVIF